MSTDASTPETPGEALERIRTLHRQEHERATQLLEELRTEFEGFAQLKHHHEQRVRQIGAAQHAAATAAEEWGRMLPRNDPGRIRPQRTPRPQRPQPVTPLEGVS